MNILKYKDCDASREELTRMFNSMKSTTKEPDRFHYIRCWNGTNEVDPIVLTAGLVSEETAPNDTTCSEVFLPASSELKETIKD